MDAAVLGRVRKRLYVVDWHEAELDRLRIDLKLPITYDRSPTSAADLRRRYPGAFSFFEVHPAPSTAALLVLARLLIQATGFKLPAR